MGLFLGSNMVSPTDIINTGSSDVDDITITKNSQDKLQSIGLKEARTETAMRLWHGTQQQWEQGVQTNWYNWYNGGGNSSAKYAAPINMDEFRIDCVNGKYLYIPCNSNNSWKYETHYSTDLQNWSQISIEDCSGLCIKGLDDAMQPIYIAYGATYSYSTDLQNWTNFTLPDFEGKIGFGCRNNNIILLMARGNSWSGGPYYAISTDNGSTWTKGSNPFSNVCNVQVINNYFVVFIDSSTTYHYSSDGINWTTGTLNTNAYHGCYGNGVYVFGSQYSTDLTTWNNISTNAPIQAEYGNGHFLGFKNSGFVLSTNGIDWTSEAFPTGVSYDTGPMGIRSNYICYNNVDDKFFIGFKNQMIIYSFGQGTSVYTIENNPTTASTVYSEPNIASALTITSVGTGTITLSDTNTYTYNANGNETTYQSIGEVHPEYICFIDGVGIKIGTTTIA